MNLSSGGQSKNNRECPALGARISSARCGSERGSKVACPADCPHFPFAIANYDKALLLTQSVVPRILEFIKSEVDRPEMANVIKQAHLEGNEAPDNPDLFFQHLVHFGLSFYRNAAGQTLAERWRAKGFAGLSNDEQIAVNGYGRAYVSALEVQEIGKDGHMWVTDVFRPNSERFLLIDRAAAKDAHRFTLILSWFLPLPHFTRISGVSAIHVPRETFAEWNVALDRSYQSARAKRPELTREEYLASTFHLQHQRMVEIGEDRRRSMLRNLDFCRAIARYRLTGPCKEIDEILTDKPEIEVIPPEAGDGFDKPWRQYNWVRRGESQALEKQMIPQFQHDDSTGSVGGLATLRLYRDRLVLEVLSRKKYEFARAKLEEWLGNELHFEAESIEDLAKMMAEKGQGGGAESGSSGEVSPYAMFASGSTTGAARRTSKSTPVPPEATRAAMQAFYDARYRRFMDEPVPMLGNATPREASRRKKMRPQLIELLKVHIHGVEETNREQGTNVQLDWLLDELGVPELKVRSSS